MRKKYPCREKGFAFCSKNCKPPVGFRVNGLGYECQDCPPRCVLGEVDLMKEADETIKEAWKLQESIKKQRQLLKKDEEKLKELYEVLTTLNVSRIGKLEFKPKINERRQIISDKFRLAFGIDLFNKLAKVGIKDALVALGEDKDNEISQCCDIKQIASWEIISYLRPGEMV